MGYASDSLIDRGAELAAVDAALRRTAVESGGLVLVEGAAGTGKSALVRRSRGLAQAAGLQVLSARGGELERDFPFGVMRQLYEPLLARTQDGERARLLAGAAEPAGWALGMTNGHGAAYAAGLAVMHAIYWLTVAAATGAPALLVVDDAHWGDASSLRALDYLARRLDDVPACLLVAVRPDEPGTALELLDRLRGVPDVVRLIVGPLGSAAVATLVRRRFPEVDDAVCDACHAATGGNPLLVEELLRAIGPRDEPPAAEEVGYVAVPSLGDRVLRRAERVDERAPTLTRAMAVLGDGARLAAAARLSGLSSEDTGRIAHRLRRIDVLAAEDPFVFVHPLIRRSVYDAIPDEERHAVHRAAATLLQQSGASADSVASHLFMLPPSGDSSLVQTFVTSADRALERAAPDEAVGWLQRALEENAAQPPRPQLLSRLGMAKALLRDPAALVNLREAFATTRDPELRLQVGVALAELAAHAGLWSEAIAVSDQLDGELRELDSELLVDAAAIRAAVTLFDAELRWDFDARRPEYERLARGDGWSARALAVVLAVDAGRRGETEDALALSRAAIADGRLITERGAGAWVPPEALGVFIEGEDFDGFEAAFEQLDVAARHTGSTLAMVTLVGFRGWAQARTGDLATAEANLLMVFDLARELELVMGLTTATFS